VNLNQNTRSLGSVLVDCKQAGVALCALITFRLDDGDVAFLPGLVIDGIWAFSQPLIHFEEMAVDPAADLEARAVVAYKVAHA